MLKVTFACVLFGLFLHPHLTIGVDTATADNGGEILESSESPLAKNIFKYSNHAISAIDKLVTDVKYLGKAISSSGTCDSVQSTNSGFLNYSLKKLLEHLIADQQEQLSDVRISGLPNLSESFLNDTGISEFKLNDIRVQGFESVTMTKFELDLCALISEVEFSLPMVEITAAYTLKGVIDGSPITGDGNLTVDIDTMYFYDQSFMDCSLVIFFEDVCTISNRNKTMDFSTKSSSVNLTGIKYKNYTENKINQSINEYVNAFILNNKMNLVQKMSDMIENLKSKSLGQNPSPASLLKKIRRDLQKLPVLLRKSQKALQDWNIYQDYLTTYF